MTETRRKSGIRRRATPAVLGIFFLAVLGVLFLGRWLGPGEASAVMPAEPTPTPPPGGSERLQLVDESLWGRVEAEPRQGGDPEVEPSTGEAAPITRFVIFDQETGARIRGARLDLLDEASSRLLGRTGADGVVEQTLPEPSQEGSWILVRASGYADREARLAEAHPRELALGLRPAATLSGRVLLPDGRSAGPDVLVLAYPVPYPLRTASDVRRLMRDRRSGSFARTDAEGAFFLDDLAQGVVHGLFAGRRGKLTMEDSFATPGTAEGNALDLVIHPLIGAVLRVRDQDGGPVHGSFEGFGEIGTFMSVRRDHASTIPTPVVEWSARLAAADVSLEVVKRESPLDMTYVAIAKTAFPRDIEATYSIRAPGYETLRNGRLRLEPLTDGIPIRQVRLQRNARGAGTVIVSFDGVSSALRPSRTGGPVAVITVFQDGLKKFSREVASFDREAPMTLEAGRYSLSVASDKTTPPWPIGEPASIDIDLRSGEEGLPVKFDLSRAGTLTIRPWKRFGEAYDGKLTVMIGTPEQFRLGVRVFKGFSSAPYRLVGLPPDEFEVRTRWPADSCLVQPPELSRVRVPPGGEALLDLALE